MATNEHTNTIPNDPNGRPCPIASGIDEIAGGVPNLIEGARGLDNYWLAHRIAKKLADLGDRAVQMHSAIEMARPNSVQSGDLQLEALLNMAMEYALETSNRIFDARGHVLVAAERLAALGEEKH